MGSLRSRPIRAVTAVRSLYAVLQDPDDTKQVFRLLEAVAGGTPARFRQQFARSRGGARLLAERPDILAAIGDRARLAALPESTLGRAYLTFMARDQLSADFLVGASQAAGVVAHETDADGYIDARLRDSHDLWHVVTGYGGDLLGEAALLAFTYAQTFSPGIGLLVSAGLIRADDPDARRLMIDAFARGARAAWLPAVGWESLLATPLEEVRARLRVGPPATYEPFYARDLPAGGLWAKPS